MNFKEELHLGNLKNIIFEELLNKHTTIGVGGVAKYFAQPDTLYQLNNLIELSKKHRIKYKVIGNGSNLLFSDQGYNGLIICTKNLKDIFIKRECVRAMAGANLSSLIDFCLSNGYGGIEELYSIPATVGGAVCMNAGAFKKNISDYVQCVETISNGKIVKYSKSQCNFSYRKSRFLGKKQTITAVDFRFPKIDKEESIKRIKEFSLLRREKQPQGKTFGSVFKNPDTLYAGQIIEELGLKGFKVGGAVISSKHANFIINQKNATADDILFIIDTVKRIVRLKTGIELQPEVEYVGKINDTISRLSHTHNI